MSTIDNDIMVDLYAEQHSFLRSTVLHLLPGVLILVFYIIATPIVVKMNAPSILAFLLAITFVLIPFQLGYLLYLGVKRNGIVSLEGIVLYREPMKLWQYIVFGLFLMIWLFVIIFVVFPPFDNYLVERYFSWLPDWFLVMNFTETLDQYSMSSILLVGIIQLLVGAVPGPLVEEIYYRGYLLPRISRFGVWAPLMNTVGFSLYHFTSLWQNPVRIIAFLPMVYAVWWKKNIYLGIIAHCGLIVISSLGILALILSLAFG